MSVRSKCIYCGSTAFGKGCRFAPFGVHMHAFNKGRCAYCNAPGFGKGCRLNPTSDLHVHGMQFNTMFREYVNDSVQNKVLLQEIQKPFTEFAAYELGLINEHGKRIRKPQTEQERASLSPFVETVIHIKQLLGHRADLLNATSVLKGTSMKCESVEEISAAMWKEKALADYKKRIDESIDQILDIVNEASAKGIPVEELQKLLYS